MEKSKLLKQALTPKLEAYFDAVEEMCRKGMMEECTDVCLFQWDGTDKCGLDLWLRKRGSNRSENFHQKMRVAFGPHGVGVHVGHYLLLLVTYRYNINSGVRRTGCHNFGMPYPGIIDRIQVRYQQLFDYDVFPNHVNQSLFKPVKAFLAVGVREMNYDGQYVEKGHPHPDLVGDMKFMAERTKLRGPPLHIATIEEKKIFNEYMKNNRGRTQKNWQQLATLYKAKANYKTVFPKLPSMVKLHYSKLQVAGFPGARHDQGLDIGGGLLWLAEEIWEAVG